MKISANLFFTLVTIIASTQSFVSCKQADRFVEISGKRQHIFEIGNGSPTLVFVTGLGDDLSTYNEIQKELSTIARTLSYDRAGLGKSEMINEDRSIDNMVTELHELLIKEKINGPYILIGHSLGGFVIRLYQHRFPKQVAGLFMIDPSCVGFFNLMKSVRDSTEQQKLDSLIFMQSANAQEAAENELRLFFSRDQELMTGIAMPSTIPVTILTSARFGDDEIKGGLKKVDKEMWISEHKKMIENSPRARHVITEKSGHYIHADEPMLVISEIKKMISQLKSN